MQSNDLKFFKRKLQEKMANKGNGNLITLVIKGTNAPFKPNVISVIS
jgi:hypothetical protein